MGISFRVAGRAVAAVLCGSSLIAGCAPQVPSATMPAPAVGNNPAPVKPRAVADKTPLSTAVTMLSSTGEVMPPNVVAETAVAPVAAPLAPPVAGAPVEGMGLTYPIADGTPLVGNRLIAFESTRGRNGLNGKHKDVDVYVFDVITTAFNPLPNANTEFLEINPEVSADGRFLVYQTDRANGSDILLYDILTGSIDTLPALNTDAFEGEASVSADGRFIAFTTDRGGSFDVYLYDRVSGFLNPLSRANTAYEEGHPDISASGRFLVFETARASGFSTLSEDGDRKKDWKNGKHKGKKGKHKWDDVAFDIVFYDVITGLFDTLPTVNTPFDESSPSISADGVTIVFESDRYGSPDVLLYDRAFEALDNMPVVNTFAFEGEPDISFDGRFIAFATDASGLGDIWLYDRVSNFVDPLPSLNSLDAIESNPSIADVVSFGAVGGIGGLATGLASGLVTGL